MIIDFTKPIRIVHNHGCMILKDWRIEGDTVIGTIIGGGEQSRLFHATLDRPYKIGTEGNWQIYKRTITMESEEMYRVDCCFCG